MLTTTSFGQSIPLFLPPLQSPNPEMVLLNRTHTTMRPHSVSKLRLKNPIVALLQISRSTSQILQIHAQLITTNLIANTFNASRLLASITSLSTPNMDYAELVFSRIQQPNTFIYNTLIKGHVDCSNPRKALGFFVGARKGGFWGDNHTYPFLLKACGMVQGSTEGREVHGEVLKRGFGSELFVVNGLIGMYCKSGEKEAARMVFDGFGGKDSVSWNLMLSGYVGSGEMEDARKVFDEMPEKDVVSWSIMIDGYWKNLGDVVGARDLFNSMPIRDLVTWNCMIDVYSKAGEIDSARELFDQMQERNVISWSIMIDGYTHHGNPKEALSLFRQMVNLGMRQDRISVMGAILASAKLGSLEQGRWIHTYMKNHRIKMDIVVQTALIDMYMKCGSLDEAREIFYTMPSRNTVSYNVMITGLGMNGFGEEALQCFAQMERDGIVKDDMILLAVLTACSHAGLVKEGLNIFQHMIEPKLEHYSCLVDLLARADQLEQALNVIDSMPMEPDSALWGSLLLACRTYQDVGLAEQVVERLVKLGSDDCGVYVVLSNIYADMGMWDCVQRTRKLIEDRKIIKETGSSIVEVNSIL